MVSTSFENDTYLLTVASVDSVTGDCDVTQRKGKVLCIYDMKLEFGVSGSQKSDAADVTGSITIEEFVHDQDEDEYVFQVKSDHAAEIKKHLLPVLRAKLMRFQADLIQAHEKDVQHSHN